MINKKQNLGNTHYHKNIEFSGNKIINYSKRLVYARSVEGLTIKDNIIEKSKCYPVDESEISILLDFCKRVNIENNKWLDFTTPATVKTIGGTCDVKLKKNKGFQEKK